MSRDVALVYYAAVLFTIVRMWEICWPPANYLDKMIEFALVNMAIPGILWQLKIVPMIGGMGAGGMYTLGAGNHGCVGSRYAG